ncbi:MAG: hypothetical protein HZB16_18315 [Armatimonadetes bacterium]|nr:hypothetical protein [Armatimonadota bacterium]
MRTRQALVLATVTALAMRGGAQPFAASPFVVNVTQPPYSARGDGVTDDTPALQQALNENVGHHRLLFFPAGTYLITRTLTWPKRYAEHDNWGKTYLRGEHRDRCVLRLRDGTFTDAARPQPIMWCGGFGSADWFHNYAENLTFDVGVGNPGATGLAFYANNSGAVRNCRFVAAEGSGAVGLDLAHRDMNGPLLVRDCEVVGFARGIATAHAVNGQTFEHIRLRGQRDIAFHNEGQTVSIRDLVSDNSVPAVGTYGTLALLEATLTGSGNASRAPAIVNYNSGRVWLRDVKTSGYARALADMQTPDFAAAFRIQGEDKPGSLGPNLVEYTSRPATSPFPSPATSLRLPIEEPPAVPWDDPATWANVDAFGADPTGRADSSAAIQKAMDSGAATVFLPGSYNLRQTVTFGRHVRRMVGVGGMVNYGKGLRPDFRLAEGEAPVVVIEHFAHIGGGIGLDTPRTLVLRSVSDSPLVSGAGSEGGRVFLEDVVTHDLRLRRQRVWARQLNIENEGLHLDNSGGDLWVLGYKTERGGTLLATRDGGRSEILGGFSYTTTAGELAPMFVNESSSVFAWFGEVCFNGNPFATLIAETRGEETRRIQRGQGGTTPYTGYTPNP